MKQAKEGTNMSIASKKSATVDGKESRTTKMMAFGESSEESL